MPSNIGRITIRRRDAEKKLKQSREEGNDKINYAENLGWWRNVTFKWLEPFFHHAE